jgi:hypothetical protein
MIFFHWGLLIFRAKFIWVKLNSIYIFYVSIYYTLNIAALLIGKLILRANLFLIQVCIIDATQF